MAFNNDKFRIYLITLKKEEEYILKIGITSKTIEERIMRKHLRAFQNGLPMFKWFTGYKVEYDTGKMFTREKAEQIEHNVLKKIPRDYYTQTHVDGISETRKYSADRKKYIINTLKTLIKTYGYGGKTLLDT